MVKAPRRPMANGLRSLMPVTRKWDRLALTLGFGAVDGMLLDLGISSMQIDQAERGFAFRTDGPLHMRFYFLITTTLPPLIWSIPWMKRRSPIFYTSTAKNWTAAGLRVQLSAHVRS